jgi:hypothetical protein
MTATFINALMPGGLGLPGPVGSIVAKVGAAGTVNFRGIGLQIDLKANIAESTFGVQIFGDVNVFGITMEFNAVFAKAQGKYVMVFGWGVPEATIDKIPGMMKSILLGNPITDLLKFTRAGVTVSTGAIDLGDYPALRFKGAQFSHLERGVAFALSAKFKESKTNGVMQALSKVNEFTLQLAVTDTVLTFSLLIERIKVSNQISLTKLGVEFKCELQSPKADISLKGSLELALGKTPGAVAGSASQGLLVFTVSASFDPIKTKVSFALSMKGMWRGAFGIKQLSIGNLIGGTTLFSFRGTLFFFFFFFLFVFVAPFLCDWFYTLLQN